MNAWLIVQTVYSTDSDNQRKARLIVQTMRIIVMSKDYMKTRLIVQTMGMSVIRKDCKQVRLIIQTMRAHLLGRII